MQHVFGMLAWNSQMKTQGLSLVHSFWGKVWKNHMIQDKVVSKDVNAKENGDGTIIVWEYSLHSYELNYEKDIYELEDHVWEEALSLNLPLKLGLVRKIILASFPNHLLKIIWIISTFPCHVPTPIKGAKQNTIGVIKKTNVKLWHHKGFVLLYLVEDEMPLIHHIIK
jgi:hypothetical protein